MTVSTTSPDYPCDRCGLPKGGSWGTPIYGAPYCMSCIRAMEKEAVEARGEKYERWHCRFGWDRRVGGSSCTGTNWEWTRNQIVDALTRTGRDEWDNSPKRWDWVHVNGPGMSLWFTRKQMPGERWGDVVTKRSSVDRMLAALGFVRPTPSPRQ